MNSADKFAEQPYECYDIRVNSDAAKDGRGRWFLIGDNGIGIQDIKDGSGYAKGDSDCGATHCNHYISDRY